MSKLSNNLDSHKAALSDQRKRLKIRLWRERGEDGPDGWHGVFQWPRCAYSDKPLTQPDDCVMHEVFIKRNALPVNRQAAIMVKENCVLVDRHLHERYGQTREFKQRCAEAQYKRYTRDRIVAWVKSLGLRQTVEIPEEETNETTT